MFDPKRRLKMSDFYKNRKTKWEDTQDESSNAEGRPVNQLLLFCDLILKYEKYKPYYEEMDDSTYSSSGENSERTNDSFSSESNSSFNHNESSSEDTKNSDTDTENDSWNLITCYCMKPYANRPMIECSVCQTWLHMSCAIIRSNNIPEYFVCQMCREAKSSRRRSARIRSGYRRYLHS